MSDNKNVPVERHKWTKAERQYVKGIVHNYSLQRWTDQDIVNFLWEEKKIRIGRSTVTRIKNQVEKQAGNWYLELREFSYRTIALYKERLDSLLSYRKKLNEIMDISEVPEIKIRAIAELHRVEMSLHSIFQEFPHEQFQIKPETEREPTNCQCMSTGIITHSNCRYCKQVWCPLTLKQDWCPNVDCGQGIKGCKFQPWDEHFQWIQCPTCEMWFKTPDILTVHNCYIKAVPAIEENRPGIGGDGQGPIPEQSLPLPTVTNQNPHYRIASSKEQESEEQESEVDRYWRTHKLKPRPKDNRIHYTIQ